MTSNQATPTAWENVALAVLERLGRPESPIDPVRVALKNGLCVAPTGQPQAGVIGTVLLVPVGLSPDEHKTTVARCLAIWALKTYGFDRTDEAVAAVSAAILWPPWARAEAAGNVVELSRARGRRRRT